MSWPASGRANQPKEKNDMENADIPGFPTREEIKHAIRKGESPFMLVMTPVTDEAELERCAAVFAANDAAWEASCKGAAS